MRYRGPAYRAHHPQWSWSPLSGDGARLHGGRFNAKGAPALYLALDWSTAVVEASQGFAFRIPPLTIVTYEVDCADIVDLTDAGELKRLGARRADLACAWKLLAETGQPVPSWALAERLRAADVAGVIVPSFAVGAAAGAKNLVLWRWSGEHPAQGDSLRPGGPVATR